MTMQATGATAPASSSAARSALRLAPPTPTDPNARELWNEASRDRTPILGVAPAARRHHRSGLAERGYRIWTWDDHGRRCGRALAKAAAGHVRSPNVVDSHLLNEDEEPITQAAAAAFEAAAQPARRRIHRRRLRPCTGNTMRIQDVSELARFKTDINLVEFACNRYGYRRERRESSVTSHVLRNEVTNDKVVVGRDKDGHWIYFSIRDARDNGSVVDFVQRRGTRSLGGVRAELRSWLGTPRPDPGPDQRPPTRPIERDRLAIAASAAQLPAATNCPYLNARGIRPETLQDARFAATWTTVRTNALFLHRDDDGVSGWEIKGSQYTGFCKGGTKTLWQSNPVGPNPSVIVLTESAIDALSHAQLHHPKPDGSPHYMSIGGNPNSTQLELLERAIRALPDRGVVVAAFDNDTGGANLTATIADLARSHHDRGIALKRHMPPFSKDWNEHLQRRERDYIRGLPDAVRALMGRTQGLAR